MIMRQELSKKRRAVVFCSVIIMILAAVFSAGCADRQSGSGEKSIRVGVDLYDQYDTFISELMEQFNLYVNDRKNDGVDIVTVVRDAAGSQSLQNEQVREMIESGCDVICVNLVDRTAPTEIIDLARKSNVPIIFFNRELVEEDLRQWDRLYYVGADAYQSGTLQGEMAADYCKEHPETDKNGDGSIQYIVLEGETGHQDSIIRTEYAVDTMIQNGILLDKAGYAIANWSRAQAKSKMMQLIGQENVQIELILANNDDMAVGAAEAYEEENIPPSDRPVIFGIDGTGVGLKAVIDGKLAGTVYNDKNGQAMAMEALAYTIASGQPADSVSLPTSVELKENKYIRLPYYTVDREKARELTVH